MKLNSFPHYLQLDAMDCGPSCLRMIAKYYGKSYSLQTLRARSFITREGVSMLGISDAAESIGFRTSGVRISLEQLKKDVPLPCILHWNQNHFVVCYDIKKKRSGYRFYIADPARQLISYSEEEFKKCWLSTKVNGEEKGAALALEPGPEFQGQGDEEESGSRSLRFFLKYLSPYRKQLIQLILGMLTASLLQLIFPFLTQSLVDVGIRDGNLNFITLILISQLVISVSQLSVEFIRSWIMLHMNTRINISLISDFLAKLMKLPLHYFDTKMIGDIMQRIGDHGRIESFLTGSSISTLFSFVNFFIFAFVLAYYNLGILAIFLVGNSLYICWILVFMKYRRELDVRRFAQAAGEQSSLIQLVTAMQEIKLNNCEKQKRWQWERIQVKLFKISVKGLALGQVQQVGSVFFNQTTNIVISFIAAKSVVEGNMTLGMMMSLTYIIGQLSGPIGSFIGFAQQLQDAKISLERLNEIHGQKDEEQDIAGCPYFLKYLFNALLKLTAILGARDKTRQVKRPDVLVHKVLGHIAGSDLPCQALDDGRLAHAGVAQDKRVVLGAARKNFHHTLDFLFATNHRVELAVARLLREVGRELLKRIGATPLLLRGIRAAKERQARTGTTSTGAGERALLVLVLGGKLLDGLLDGSRRHTQAHEDVHGHAVALFDDADQQVLGRHVGLVVLTRHAE